MNITDQELGFSEIFRLQFPLPSSIYELTICATSFENAKYWASIWLKGRKMELPEDVMIFATGSMIMKPLGTVIMEMTTAK